MAAVTPVTTNDSSSSSPPVVYKEGSLLKGKDQRRKSWNQKWVVLTRGTLYYYRKKTNFSPAGVIELKDFELEDSSSVKVDKKNLIVLRNKEDRSKKVLFSSASEQERDEWEGLIKQQMEKPPSPPPENQHARAKGAKYYFQTNVASSIVGRKIIKEVVDADSWRSLDAIVSFLKKARGDQVAHKFKKDLIRIGTKLAILHNNKMVSDEAMLIMNNAVRVLAQTVVDYYQIPSIFDAPTLVTYINELRKASEPHLENKVKPSTLQKYRELFDVACSEELLNNLFEKGKWPELVEIATIIRKHITNR